MERRTKVLVVDDDVNICELIRLYLEKEGCEVQTVYNGKSGLEAFVDSAPGIVILDIMLPGMDGWQVCREIRKISNIPIIMLTAKGETFDKVLGLELGADDYIVKPFEPKELVARVKAVLRRYERSDFDDREVVFPNLVINKSTYVVKLNGKRSIFRQRNWNCCISLRPTPTRCSPESSCWNAYGDMIIMVTAGPWMCTSKDSGRR